MSGAIQKPTAQCPHCGDEFTSLKGGKIPTHDYPRPCRSVCPGSGEEPKQHADTPLWKDDPNQRAKNFFDSARMELRLYGFAVVKQVAELSGTKIGFTECPLCGKQVKFLIASNGHCRAKCETDQCINAQE